MSLVISMLQSWSVMSMMRVTDVDVLLLLQMDVTKCYDLADYAYELLCSASSVFLLLTPFLKVRGKVLLRG